MDKATTVWVPIARLVFHPQNANRMSNEMREKLRRNIEANGGYYPPVIVRSLEKTIAFQAEASEDKLQVMDGEHRVRDAIDRGESEVEVRIWRGITDDQARQLLLTLNRIHGEDDRGKRAQLLRDLAEAHGDPEYLAAFLPENVETISKMMEEATRAHVQDARERVRNLTQQEAVTFFMRPEQAEKVRQAMGVWLRDNDPGGAITECRDGAALDGMARYYLGDDEKT